MAGYPPSVRALCVAAQVFAMLGDDARIETASVDAVVAGFAEGAPVSGYTNNIHMDDTDPEFVYGGTYRLSLYVNHSNPTELNPNTPAVVYSNSFIIP